VWGCQSTWHWLTWRCAAQMMPGMSTMQPHPSASFMSKASKPATERDESSSSGSEEELNERLRELKGIAKDRDAKKKLTKAEQDEKNLFSKNKGALGARGFASRLTSLRCACQCIVHSM
jgi:hypothetical protein